MPTQHEYRLNITAQDEASATFRKVSGEMQNLNKFIKEGQRDNRQMNFLFRESVGTVRALSNTFVGPSGLVGSLGKGFDALQGVEFGLSAVGSAAANVGGKIGNLGGILTRFSLGIGAVAASFLMVKDYMDETTKTSEALTERIMKLDYELGNLSKTQYLGKLQEKWLDLFLELQKVTKGTLGSNIKFALEQTFLGPLTAMQGRGNAVREVIAQMKELEVLMKKIEDKGAKPTTQKAGQRSERADNQRYMVFKELPRLRSVVDQMLDGVVSNMDVIRVQASEIGVSLTDAFAAAWDESEAWAYSFNSGINALSGGIANGFSNAFQRAFGEAHSLLQQFTVSVLDSITRIASRLAASAILGGIGSFLGLGSFGGIFSALTGGLFGASAPVRSGGGLGKTISDSALRPGGAATVVVNINAPVDNVSYVKQAVEEGLRRTGLTVNQYLVSNRDRVSIVR